MAELRTDLIPKGLSEEPKRIIVYNQFRQTIDAARKYGHYSKTPAAAKDIFGTMDLVRRALLDMERREETLTKNKISFTEERPDFSNDGEVITFSVVRSEPGAFGEGRPFESNIKNLVPILREELDDPDNPGYKMAILGYWYDNIIRLTCFARTNKQANRRVVWLQGLMQDYMWFFRTNGVNRILFWGRGEDFVVEENGARLYGRPLEYFVRTENVRQLREKTIEEITLDTGLADNGSELRDELVDS